MLTKEVFEQLDWAKKSLVGKSFINKKNRNTYFVKGITIDKETYEFRVIYFNGKSVNDWDTSLVLFLEKFELNNYR